MTKEQEEKAIENKWDLEAVEAYLERTGDDDFENFAEAYMGMYFSDEAFVEDLLEQWLSYQSRVCINWKQTTLTVMKDYYEEDGHYFKIL